MFFFFKFSDFCEYFNLSALVCLWFSVYRIFKQILYGGLLCMLYLERQRKMFYDIRISSWSYYY